jgi:hypothetical protein
MEERSKLKPLSLQANSIGIHSVILASLVVSGALLAEVPVAGGKSLVLDSWVSMSDPICFLPNGGQVPEEVLYYVASPLPLAVMADGVMILVRAERGSYGVKLQFHGSRFSTPTAGGEPCYAVNFITSGPSAGPRKLLAYREIHLRDLYEDIDLTLRVDRGLKLECRLQGCPLRPDEGSGPLRSGERCGRHRRLDEPRTPV